MVESVRDEITELAASIRALERQLELALAKRRVELNYKIHDGVVQFEGAEVSMRECGMPTRKLTGQSRARTQMLSPVDTTDACVKLLGGSRLEAQQLQEDPIGES